ncbi:MAG: DUF1684 domain-containing protein [Daejeonella sp.]
MKKTLFFLFISFTSLNIFAQEISRKEYKQRIIKHRDEYQLDFLNDKRSPLQLGDLQNLRFYKPDAEYSVKAEVEILKDQPVFKMLTFDGSAKQYVRYAVLKFNLKGEARTLTLYRSIALMENEQYKDYLFLPFTDLTNGKKTYGGGRYIDLKTKDISSGTFALDFNIAYNPYCAYSTGYSCPIPPQENDLNVAIKAGEKNFAGEKKHQ